MVYPVWAVCVDGPLEGLVIETDVAAKAVEITLFEYDGVACYRRAGWYTGRGHRIAQYKFTKTLVI